jgi:hypothetical protein
MILGINDIINDLIGIYLLFKVNSPNRQSNLCYHQ